MEGRALRALLVFLRVCWGFLCSVSVSSREGCVPSYLRSACVCLAPFLCLRVRLLRRLLRPWDRGSLLQLRFSVMVVLGPYHCLLC